MNQEWQEQKKVLIPNRSPGSVKSLIGMAVDQLRDYMELSGNLDDGTIALIAELNTMKGEIQ